jgi:hypothetical protein
MTRVAETNAPDTDFSLVVGGPLFQLFRRAHLCDDAMSILWLRLLVITGFCWLPLCILSAIEGHLLPGTTAIAFFNDIENQVRFLISLPMLILAEVFVHQRLGLLMRLFTDRDLVAREDLPRFQAARSSAAGLRNSFIPELGLVGLVFLISILVTPTRIVGLHLATWYVGGPPEGSHLTLAGMWYAYLSLPLFQFLLLRWYFRLFIWARFLWQVSRIRLQLVPTHPDRVGALAFLGNTGVAFGFLLLAQGALVSGQLANRIFYFGAKLESFLYVSLMYVVFVLLAVTAPLAAFVPQLSRARRLGRAEYGNLANLYMRGFDEKWVQSRTPAGEPLLGSADIQSLADMGNSYSVLQEMGVFPLSRQLLIQLVVLAILPLIPLLLTVMPLEELLKKLFGLLL